MARALTDIQRDKLKLKLSYAKQKLAHMKENVAGISLQSIREQELEVQLLELDLEELDAKLEAKSNEPAKQKFTENAIKK